MRFSLATAALVVAVPALAADAAADGPLGQYKAQFQNFLGKFTGYVADSAVVQDGPVAAVEAKVGEIQMSHLTLENWKDTLYAPVKEGAEVPEEWWVLITGRNKTCFGMNFSYSLLTTLCDLCINSIPRSMRKARKGFQRDRRPLHHHPQGSSHGHPQLRG